MSVYAIIIVRVFLYDALTVVPLIIYAITPLRCSILIKRKCMLLSVCTLWVEWFLWNMALIIQSIAKQDILAWLSMMQYKNNTSTWMRCMSVLVVKLICHRLLAPHCNATISISYGPFQTKTWSYAWAFVFTMWQWLRWRWFTSQISDSF